MALPIICYNRSGSFIREVLNTLLSPEVKLYPGALVLGIDHREGVTSEEMHVPEGLGNSAVGHDDGYLVSRRESSICAPAFGVHPALRNDLAIKVGELLYQPDVLE